MDANHKDKIDKIRQAMPGVISSVYLNSATCGPLPQCCINAIEEQSQKQYKQGRIAKENFAIFYELIDHLQARIAKLIDANAEEIVLTQHTTEAINIVLWGIDWQQGDEVITSTLEHPALLAPLRILQKRCGICIHRLPFSGNKHQDKKLLRQKVGDKTKLVALSHVSNFDGHILPIKEIVAICKQTSIPLLLDGAQAAGVLPFSVRELEVDFYAAPGQKWLCGPEGTGFLYIAKEWQERIQTTFAGYYSLDDPYSDFFDPAKGANRYRHGGFYPPIIFGLNESLGFLESVGLPWIWKRVTFLAGQLYEKLASYPQVKFARDYREGIGSIITFYIEGLDSAALAQNLTEKNIFVRCLELDNISQIRVSIGFYNTLEDVDQFVEILGSGNTL